MTGILCFQPKPAVIATPTVLHQPLAPLVPLQEPMSPLKLYPELRPELSAELADETSSSSSVSFGSVQLHVPSAAASWNVNDVAAISDR